MLNDIRKFCKEVLTCGKGEKKDEKSQPDNRSFSEKVKDRQKEIETGIMNGDKKIWSLVFRSFILGIVGIIAVAVIFCDFILERNHQRFLDSHIIFETNKMPNLVKGTYRVLNATKVPAKNGVADDYLISFAAADGGLVMSAFIPNCTTIPKTFENMYLQVDEFGRWEFTPYREIKKAQ